MPARAWRPAGDMSDTIFSRKGSPALRERVGFRPPLGQRIASFLRRHPNEFYLPGTEVLTLAIMSAIVLLLTNTYTSPELIFFSMVMLLLPCSQSAIQLVNYLITSLLEPQILPKLDFSEGVPDNCTTLVAIPSLLFNQEQVRRLVEDLEVRFLGNHDPNIHFALLTDLPDSPVPATEDDPLIDYCAQLMRELNEKYAGQAVGIVSALPSPPGLQPARKSVDGLGAQTRQADGLEQAAAQRARQLSR